MCIVLISTAHPKYALVVIDNRDEFVLRPTSRPHWWKLDNNVEVLSSRDLQRRERGTWLGITRDGIFSVLTNYRESSAGKPVAGARSRGSMVTAWLGSGTEQSAVDSVRRLVMDGSVTSVGGFSMVCGKLKKRKDGNLEPLDVVSNRCDHVDNVPWIAGGRGQVYGLSNTVFDNPDPWPKVEDGKRLLAEAIESAVKDSVSEDKFADMLYAILDRDTLPRDESMPLAEYVMQLKRSIFIPPIGDELHRQEMQAATALGKAVWATDYDRQGEAELKSEERPAATETGFETGMYGTQRQTIVLVGWDGEVSYRERALWDGNGNPIPRGEDDVVFRFKIEGWE